MIKKEKQEIWLILLILSIIYLSLKHFVIYWEYIVYPISLLVTFLHEFWHSFFAFITWWWVKWVLINPDWSWLAITYWWIRPLVLMGGYIWSAIFWNLLLYIWATKKNISKIVLLFFSFLMFVMALFSFSFSLSQIISTFILILLSISLAFITLKIKDDSFNRIFLMFLWIASILYIIEDFNIWPSSDLQKFSQMFVFIPQYIWMIIWLIIVILITLLNIKNIFKK